MLTEQAYGNVMLLKIRPSWTVRRALSGRGGATDPHGHMQCVRVVIPANLAMRKVGGN